MASFRQCNLIIFLCLLLGANLLLVNTTLAGVPVLSTKHKFAANEDCLENAAPEADDESSSFVYLKASKKRVGRRSARTGNIALSPNNLKRKLSAKSAFVMDAQSLDVLYSHASDLARQPASTIKVLTGLIAIDSLQDDELIPVSRRAARMPRSKIWLSSKKSYNANDLINAVLLASANDASVALAERIAGSEKVFAKLMTAKAKELGAQNTVCKTSNGLTAHGQKSTARDLALIFNGAMQKETFADKMARRKIRTRYGQILYSHNKALWMVEGTQGGKTGYTSAARQTYVGKFKRGSDEIVVAIMGSETMWDDVKNLVEYGFKRKQVVQANFARAESRKSFAPVSISRLSDQKKTPSPLVLSLN